MSTHGRVSRVTRMDKMIKMTDSRPRSPRERPALISPEEQRRQWTLDAMADVDAGHVIDDERVRAWADSLDTETPLPLPLPANAIIPGRSMTRLFAYGTLQRSFRNHDILSSRGQGARFLGAGMNYRAFRPLSRRDLTRCPIPIGSARPLPSKGRSLRCR